jgi:hypothetical protein
MVIDAAADARGVRAVDEKMGDGDQLFGKLTRRTMLVEFFLEHKRYT